MARCSRVALYATLLVLATAGWTPLPLPCRRTSRVSRLVLAVEDDAPDMNGPSVDAELQKAINSRELESFNSDLYEHLGRRPEYETSELYSSLRKRVDVDDPLYSELKERRAMLENAPMPSTDQTPTEVIELVLRALRDVDWPRANHGTELLRTYSGPASILGDDRPEVTAQMLVEYFASSKYSILLDWVSISYPKRLQLSMDKKRALQQLKLTSASGESVPITFQLSKHPAPEGEVWLIDQLLVKSL